MAELVDAIVLSNFVPIDFLTKEWFQQSHLSLDVAGSIPVNATGTIAQQVRALSKPKPFRLPLPDGASADISAFSYRRCPASICQRTVPAHMISCLGV